LFLFSIDDMPHIISRSFALLKLLYFFLIIILPAVCEHAYSLAQNLDPNSEGRGVLQFKTGLMSVIKVYLLYMKIFGLVYM